MQQKIISIHELRKYNPNLGELNFADLMFATFLHQKENWGMLSEGWKGFHSSKYKLYDFNWPATEGVDSHMWFGIKTQFNPTRFTSSSAKVDAESINSRKCFLCLENLPEEQKGVLFEDDMIVLCNPAPIFNEHFTISHIDHKPQSIDQNIEKMIRLTKACNGDYTIFYNGPKCGASAPDHFHFQACPSDELITENDIKIHLEKFPEIISNKHLSIRKSNDYLRNVVVLISEDVDLIVERFHFAYRSLQEIVGATEEPFDKAQDEPMMNLFSFLHNERFHLVIFPREKHRPDIYFLDGEDRMLVSPGLVDMAGMLITPLQKDFEKMDNELIKKIYDEVSLKHDKFEQLIRLL